jgi:hypothetical protein
MKFLEFSQIFSQPIEESEEDRYTPTKDEIRHFQKVRRNIPVDHSQDFHNVVLRKLYNITSKINNEKLRKKFSEVIFKNMGNLLELVEAVKKLNEVSEDNSQKKELAKYLEKIEAGD